MSSPLPPAAQYRFDTARQPEPSGTLTAFFKKVDAVKKDLVKFRSAVIELKKSHADLAHTTDKEAKEFCRGKSSALHTTISEKSTRIKDELDSMQMAIAKAAPTAEIRIQENQHMLLHDEFVKLLTLFHKVEQDSRQKYRDTIKRQVITTARAQNRELSEAESDEIAQQLISQGREQNVFSSRKMQIAASALEEAAEMRNDIHQIEVALRSLHQVFVDMQTLVNEQGEMIRNDLRSNIDRATDYVVEGRKQIAKARGR
ncbi:Syntaxin [Diplonema papillatum]|nr:Syntaxin [Diplonema papillatum]